MNILVDSSKDDGVVTKKIIDSINKKAILDDTDYISGIVYFRMWKHIFDFKSKQDRKSCLIDLLIYYSISAGVMFLYRWFTTLFVGIQVCFLWLAYYLIYCFIPLSTYARRARSAGYPWWVCFGIIIPLINLFPISICFLPEAKRKILKSDCTPYSKRIEQERKGWKILFPLIPLIFVSGASLLIRVLYLDAFFGNIVIEKSTYIDDYEYYCNSVRYADSHLPQTLEGFNDYIEIKFGYKKVSSSRFLGFEFDGLSLFASYGDDYLDEKERILSKYEFATYEEVKSDIGFETFDYKGFTFHIDKQLSTFGYSHELFMIGFNDSNHCVSFLYYYDFDRDLITYWEHSDKERLNELIQFMDKSFLWVE